MSEPKPEFGVENLQAFRSKLDRCAAEFAADAMAAGHVRLAAVALERITYITGNLKSFVPELTPIPPAEPQ
jgi:hypothetical protein